MSAVLSILQESYSSWIADGNSATYERTFYSTSEGETAHSVVKLVVNSAGETASDIHSVDVARVLETDGSSAVGGN
jgi:hypothetical protein